MSIGFTIVLFARRASASRRALLSSFSLSHTNARTQLKLVRRSRESRPCMPVATVTRLGVFTDRKRPAPFKTRGDVFLCLCIDRERFGFGFAPSKSVCLAPATWKASFHSLSTHVAVAFASFSPSSYYVFVGKVHPSMDDPKRQKTMGKEGT